MFRDSSEFAKLVLIDLGFAVHNFRWSKLTPRCGTAGYTAPEVLAEKEYDCKIDVFSAGVVFYTMLTGR